MKIRRLKTILRTAIIGSIIALMPLVSFAGTFSKTYSGQFTSSWDKYATKTLSDGSTVRLSYGFNTFLINEDCVSAYFDGNEHYVKIENGSGDYASKITAAREYAELEVRHSGNTVTYSDNWS